MSVKSLPSRGAPSYFARMYEVVERFMPWKYTGIFSHPEFKEHVPVVGAWRDAPTNPTFTPIVPSIDAEGVFEVKKFKDATKRSELLADRELSVQDIQKMASWQESTPMGSARFRWNRTRRYIYDYDDNGYR